MSFVAARNKVPQLLQKRLPVGLALPQLLQFIELICYSFVSFGEIGVEKSRSYCTEQTHS